MTGPKLGDVVDVLYRQFEIINDPKLTGSKLDEQLNKSRQTVLIARQITEVAKLALDAQKALPDMLENTRLPDILTIDYRK